MKGFSLLAKCEFEKKDMAHFSLPFKNLQPNQCNAYISKSFSTKKDYFFSSKVDKLGP